MVLTTENKNEIAGIVRKELLALLKDLKFSYWIDDAGGNVRIHKDRQLIAEIVVENIAEDRSK